MLEIGFWAMGMLKVDELSFVAQQDHKLIRV